MKIWFAKSAVSGSGGGSTQVTPEKMLNPRVKVRQAAWNRGNAKKNFFPLRKLMRVGLPPSDGMSW